MKIKKNVKKLIRVVKRINWHTLAIDVSKKEGLKKSLSLLHLSGSFSIILIYF